MEKVMPTKGLENISDLDKQKIVREFEVKSINEASDSLMQMIYTHEKLYFREKIELNEEDDIPLSEEELKQINQFWAPYSFAYKNNPETQRLISRISGRFDPSYITWQLQYNILKTFWNSDGSIFQQITAFKNLIALMFPYIRMPQTYVMYGWGQYFDGDQNVITQDEAADILYQILKEGQKVIIKPSHSNSGKGIILLETDLSREEVAHILDEYDPPILDVYNDNFICQQVIENHPSYNVSKALNTMRITTLNYAGKILWVGTMLRIGVTSDIVDNFSRGGIACPVDENGICGNYAASRDGKKYYEHPNGFKFAGHKLYNYEKAHELALTLHKRFPFAKYISWDIVIDKTGEPIVIEFNIPGAPLVLQVGGFNPYRNKEIMKEVLDECLIRKFFYRKAVMDWNYREYRDAITLEKYAGFDTTVKVPESISGKKITFILSGAITDPKIKEIYIPKSVKLGNNAIAVPNAKVIVTE